MKQHASNEAGSAPAMATQDEIRAWFDATYERRGVKYLRPVHAYPIYLQLLGAQPGQRLLDVGCGPGLLLEAALERGLEAVGLDLSPKAVEIAKRRLPRAQPHVGNAEDLPFEDDSFDFVTCIGSLERMRDRRLVLSEMKRVAKPGARYCFLVRNSEHAAWRVWHHALRRRKRKAHQDAQTLDTWTELFRSCGFEVERVLPDQWPRQRLRRALGVRRKAGRDERVHEARMPLRWALEFLFLLRA